MKNFTIGSDIEFPVIKDLEFICAHTLGLPDKYQPRKITEFLEVSYDNAFVEINTKPAGTLEEFVNNTEQSLKDLFEFLNPLKAKVINFSSIILPDEFRYDPIVLASGCAPDFNAWEEGKENPPLDLFDEDTRCCSGHIHIGGDFPDPNRFVRLLDKFVGIPLMELTAKKYPNKIKEEYQRRKLYGKAGAYRLNKVKYHGVEYRTPSNLWAFDKEFQEMIYNGVKESVNTYHETSYDPIDEKEAILKVINGD